MIMLGLLPEIFGNTFPRTYGMPSSLRLPLINIVPFEGRDTGIRLRCKEPE